MIPVLVLTIHFYVFSVLAVCQCCPYFSTLFSLHDKVVEDDELFNNQILPGLLVGLH